MNIIILAIIQATYDFLVWGLWFNEAPSQYKYTVRYRVAKFMADYPVTYLIICGVAYPNKYAIAFYIFKQMGGIDWIYKQGDDFILKRHWHNGVIDWLWWTSPFGWIATIIASWKEKTFVKGKVTLLQFYIEVAIGFVTGIIILILK